MEISKPCITQFVCVSSRLQRTSKVRALDQVKAWCGAEEGEPAAKKVKKELSSEDEDYSDPDSTKGRILHHIKIAHSFLK